jgi:hypothetical protein
MRSTSIYCLFFVRRLLATCLLLCAFTVHRNLYTAYPETQVVYRFRGSLIETLSSYPECIEVYK